MIDNSASKRNSNEMNINEEIIKLYKKIKPIDLSHSTLISIYRGTAGSHPAAGGPCRCLRRLRSGSRPARWPGVLRMT